MKKMVLKDASLQKMVIDADMQLDIEVNPDENASLYIYMEKDVNVKYQIHVHENASLNLLIWNESQGMLSGESFCERNAQLSFNLGELQDKNTKQKHLIHLCGEESRLNLKSANIIKNTKTYEIVCLHEAPHTYSNMENYAIVYENGTFEMIDTGKIVKGAYGSESHQTSRALILDEHARCNITPELLIDENDVQASHATTMGQIDENQLYYLETRGLTQKQALGLITIGYLMPMAHVLEDEALNLELSTIIEKKVGLS